MTAAALTPRVRMMAVCDGVRESKIEAGTFDLKRVRQEIQADAFPFVTRLWLFLLLSSPRPGEFPGYVRIVNERTEKTVFYSHLLPRPTFEESIDFLALPVKVRCSIPEPGRYFVQICFFQEYGSDIVKGELPLLISEG